MQNIPYSKKVRAAFICKNFQGSNGVSHIGLTVAARNIANVLNAHGIPTQIETIPTADLLMGCVQQLVSQQGPSPLTHVVISAPWVPVTILGAVCAAFPWLRFSVTTHSNLAFLTAEPAAINIIADMADLEAMSSNFHVGVNSHILAKWLIGQGYPCTWLPNLYYLDNTSGQTRPPWSQRGGVIEAGSFGALRVQKNHLVNLGAAMALSADLKTKVNLHINVGRDKSAEAIRIVQAMQNLNRINRNVTLVQHEWSTWPTFRRLVESMDINFQMTTTETFNMVAADSVSRGVSVVGTKGPIYWLPSDWTATCDDQNEAGSVARRLLFDPSAPRDGLLALQKYNNKALHAWLDFILHNRYGVYDQQWDSHHGPMRVGHESNL